MEITCEDCGNSNWTIALREIRISRITSVVTVLECKDCGMIYPLHRVGTNTSKEKMEKLLKSLAVASDRKDSLEFISDI